MFTTFNHKGYSIKGFKSCTSTDGEAFSLTLLKNGKKIGTVHNSGTGAPNHYDLDCGEMAELKTAARSVLDEGFEVEDVFIENLINDWDNDKRFRRLCKKSIIYRIMGDKAGQYRQWVTIFSSDKALEIRNHFKAKNVEVEEILNEKLDKTE